MKLPSTSPSSCSAASPSAYHLNSDAAAAGWCSAILRRLVCGTLDVASSSRSRVADAGTDGAVLVPEKAGSLKPPASTPPSAAPGIVARLMGLDSMPELPSAALGPISRSRSTGSLEGWPVLLPVQTHRRSHSFRETPTFLRPENDEFLLLSFSPEDGDVKSKISEPLPNPTNREVGLRQLDQRDAVEEDTRERPNHTERAADKTPTKQQQQKKKKKKNVQRKTSREKPAAESCRRHLTPPNKAEAHIKTRSRGPGPAKTATHGETPERTRPTKKKSSVGLKTTPELECSSQNSSPVSVLDRLPELDGESLTDTSTPISDAEEEEEEEPGPEESPRRKLSSPLDCFDDPSKFFHLILVEDKEGSTATEEGRAGTRDATSLPRPHLWGEACRLAGGDHAQRQPWKTQDPEELVVEFGLHILESLLRETVDEICHHVPAAAAPPQLMCIMSTS